ncbi:MAG TPA: hypothetical protein VI356_06735 [Myxococcales bacterium]
MRPLIVFLLLSAPLAAAENESRLRIAVGGSWAVPLATPDGYHGTHQDTALSGLVQWEAQRFLVQLEVAGGGFWAANPQWLAISGRVGLFLGRAPDVYVAVGPAFATENALSVAECPQFGCDPFNGSGAAVSAEIAVRLPRLGSVQPSLFGDVLIPLFQVHQDVYPAAQSADGVGLALFGLRLFLF